MRISASLHPILVATLAILSLHQSEAVEPGGDNGKLDREKMRAKMLKRIDTNGDGKMSKAELAKARSQFTARQAGLTNEEHHRLEIVTLPPEVQKADSNMNQKALLYHPLKKSEGKIPLIVILHGAGGTKQKEISAFQGNRDVRWVMTPANSKHIARVLVPHSRSHWNPDALNKVVDHLLTNYENIDNDRVYCIGYSLGGLGTWNWARHSPGRLAAIVPVAFIADQNDLEKLVDLPIWAMVGTGDRRRAGTIPAMEKSLKELGSIAIRTTVFEGANHGQSASKAWAQDGLLDWLFAQSRKK